MQDAAAVAGPSTLSPSTPVRPQSTSRASSLAGTPTSSYSTFNTQTPAAAFGSLAAGVEARLRDGEPSSASNGRPRRAKSESRKTSRRWSRTSERRSSSRNLGLGLRRPRSHADGVASGSNTQRRSISQALVRALAGESETEEEWSDDEHGRKIRRASTVHFLAHPSAYTEVIATYSPRVSAVIRPSGTHSPINGHHSRRRLSATAPSGGYGNIPYSDDDDQERQRGSAIEVLEIASEDIPYGVRKMEMLSRYMTTKPYIPIYIITLFTSLSSTTTPAVEPFLLSTFGGHAYISSIAIVTSIAYAVCKPPMAKILDTFGRAEGLAISALLYGLGFILVSSSSGIVSFAAARVLGSAGAQGINLAQQVIVADITSLASRALVTSTIFLPWLLTPWLGPPLGQVFKDAGEAGYRSAYTLFGVAVPLSCLFLLFFLWNGYRKVLQIAKDSKPVVEALKQTAGDGESVQADDALVWEPRGVAELATEAREELDLLGIIYLMTGATLFLLPLSLAATSAKAWSDRKLHPEVVQPQSLISVCSTVPWTRCFRAGHSPSSSLPRDIRRGIPTHPYATHAQSDSHVWLSSGRLSLLLPIRLRILLSLLSPSFPLIFSARCFVHRSIICLLGINSCAGMRVIDQVHTEIQDLDDPRHLAAHGRSLHDGPVSLSGQHDIRDRYQPSDRRPRWWLHYARSTAWRTERGLASRCCHCYSCLLDDHADRRCSWRGSKRSNLVDLPAKETGGISA